MTNFKCIVIGLLIAAFNLQPWILNRAAAEPVVVNSIQVVATGGSESNGPDPLAIANAQAQSYLFGVDEYETGPLFLSSEPITAGDYQGTTLAGDFEFKLMESVRLDMSSVSFSAEQAAIVGGLSGFYVRVAVGVMTVGPRSVLVGALAFPVFVDGQRRHVLLPFTVDLYDDGDVMLTSAVAEAFLRTPGGGTTPTLPPDPSSGDAAACLAGIKACNDAYDDTAGAAKDFLLLCVGPISAGCIAGLVLGLSFCIVSGGTLCTFAWWLYYACGGVLITCIADFVNDIVKAYFTSSRCVQRVKASPECIRAYNGVVPM
jgi:hypothetical protein